MRHEAAEALGEQPQLRALPALERVIFEAADPQSQSEAVEALGEFGVTALDLLQRVIWQHPVSSTKREAVETLRDIGTERALPLLAEIFQRHPDSAVKDEVLDVLADIDSPAARKMLLDAVMRSKPETRREAVELIGSQKTDARTSAEIAELAAFLERLVFEDPDRAVRFEALEAMAKLPRDTALRLLRKVIDKHADQAVRREAVDVLGEIR